VAAKHVSLAVGSGLTVCVETQPPRDSTHWFVKQAVLAAHDLAVV
jgi:hypothetical protein